MARIMALLELPSLLYNHTQRSQHDCTMPAAFHKKPDFDNGKIGAETQLMKTLIRLIPVCGLLGNLDVFHTAKVPVVKPR